MNHTENPTPRNRTPVSGPFLVTVVIVVLAFAACSEVDTRPPADETVEVELAIPLDPNALTPIVITEQTAVDSDDPAIWINPDDPGQSLILGTDKGGSIFVFDLDGKIIPEKTVRRDGRMNNIDVEYGFPLGGETIDIAVATDRNENMLRVFRLPDMTPVDNGGIAAFEGEDGRSPPPMGIALYKRPSDGAVFAIVSRKTGPSGTYLWQYLLEDDGDGHGHRLPRCASSGPSAMSRP